MNVAIVARAGLVGGNTANSARILIGTARRVSDARSHPFGGSVRPSSACGAGYVVSSACKLSVLAVGARSARRARRGGASVRHVGPILAGFAFSQSRFIGEATCGTSAHGVAVAAIGADKTSAASCVGIFKEICIRGVLLAVWGASV